MAPTSERPVDPSDEDHREVGEGLLEEESSPGTMLAHLYRGEIHRMRFWRERLDRTTYWAVLIMSAILTWTFSSRNNPHYMLLLGVVALATFLVIEARRYRGYDLWRGRVRTLQRNVFAYGLDPSGGIENPDWREELGRDYRRPALKISVREALAHRLRRVYLLLFTVTLAAWLVRVTAFATRPFPRSAAVGEVPGVAVVAVVAVFYLAAAVVGLRPRSWRAEDELHRVDLDRRQ